MADFTGKVVLITGAAGGIGQELCRHFADHGAAIAALDQTDRVIPFASQLNAARSAAAVADIGSIVQLGDAVSTLVATLGDIDILINNAGFSERATLETTSPEDWRHAINGNLNGTFNCTNAVLPAMTVRGAGTIVNIGSINGLMSLGDPSYSAAKAGMISYTRALAMEYGRFGIRANIVCPGTVRTPIWTERVKRNPEILDQLVKWYPLRRVADPIDIAKVVAFLASDDAAAITGAVLPVDCGLSAGNIVMSRELTLDEF